MGNVLSAGMGQAPARQAAIGAGLPTSVEATTINKVCASGLKSVALAAQDVQLGLAKAIVAGGMENMSRVPLLIPRASGMPAFGEIKIKDAVVADGLWDPYNDIHMGKHKHPPFKLIHTHTLTTANQATAPKTPSATSP